MKEKRFWTLLLLTGALLSNGMVVAAQDKSQTKQERDIVIMRDEVFVRGEGQEAPPPPRVPMIEPAGAPGDTFVFVSSEMSFDGSVVKNAPYSAQAVTETTQTLADGNRIVRKNTASVYRDSEGRTRRDQAIGAIGPFAAAGDPPQTVFINDPVAKVNYVLDPRSRTARKHPLPQVRTMKPAGTPRVYREVAPPQGTTPQATPQAAPQPPREPRRVEEFVFTAPPAPGAHGGQHVMRYSGPRHEPKREPLGKQVVEGVEAEGTRTTLTIPAGEIGNEQPINIVSERWYSPELQTVVMTRHNDPRFGETVYRLTNINRSEPARTLFEVPSDYTVKEAPSAPFRFHFETKKKEGDKQQQQQ